MTIAWTVERLDKHHEREHFDCGNDLLNDWLKQRAGQFDRRDLARTFVAVRPGENVVCGYYAVSSHSVRLESLPADEAKGLGLGGHLLIDVLRRAQHLAEHVGIRAVEVDAIDEAARTFYLRYGFLELQDDPRHLFLPMSVIRKLHLPPMAI